MDPNDALLAGFLRERSRIFKDIKQFLSMVLKYCLYLEKKTKDSSIKSYMYIAAKIRINLPPLIESLCLIHALYGYPDSSGNETATSMDKDAIKTCVKNKKKEGKSLWDYCKKAEDEKEDEEHKFWRFKFSDETSTLESICTSLWREPAYMFLEMVRDLCDIDGVDEEASTIGRKWLECLYDTNYLKPKTWAEVVADKKRPECFGVSVGVRTFVRPLFLYIKLSQLRKNGNNHVKLEDVNAFRRIINGKKNHDSKSEYTKSEKCGSCEIFFAGCKDTNKKNINMFGNCAEYDVIQTENLDRVLRRIETTNHWKDFKSACEEHFKEFNKLKRDNPSQDELKSYYAKIREAKPKMLQYQWKSDIYELVAVDSPCSK